ncbi:hypothetical protein GCM10025860_15310 [Methanobacterium ferruginis]|nr:hypothetical protein GCM10025860_15310 [Methanobacterium ferruginis]
MSIITCHETISTLKSCTSSIQLKFSDYFDEKVNMDRVIYDRLKPEQGLIMPIND